MKSDAKSRTLTLVIPVANAAAGDAAMRPQALELLLTRAQQVTAMPNFETLLCRLFDVTLRPDADVPIAPVTYGLDHGETPQGYCLRADPVHAAADRDVLRMLDPRTLAIAPPEAQALVATLNAHFAQDGLQFAAPQPQRWYLDLPTDPALRTHPLADAIGASMHDYLPFGTHGKRWQGILNEIQMVLHEHPVNLARGARGELTINSVWFWGGGQTPPVAQKCWAQVWSDDVVALGLAKLSGVPRTGAPESARAWLNAAVTPGEHLLVLPGESRVELAGMDAAWFAPLLAALKKRVLQRLTLHLVSGAGYSVDTAALKRWWIRRRELAQFLSAPV
ncbi:MAG: hypothetical protein HY273_10725 [Gammaproteobacteria bacterium]|nr:hypothetical protein [Gammaproteobacteria bacterium]